MGQSKICISQSRFHSGNVEPAYTLPYQPYLVLYLAFEGFSPVSLKPLSLLALLGVSRLVSHAAFFSRDAVIGIFLAPLFYFHIPTLETVRIRFQPLLMALPLALCPALLVTATLLDFPDPGIRLVIPTTVNTPLLSSVCWFHSLC